MRRLTVDCLLLPDMSLLGQWERATAGTPGTCPFLLCSLSRVWTRLQGGHMPLLKKTVHEFFRQLNRGIECSFSFPPDSKW